MTWQEVIIESLRITSCTIIAVVLIKVIGKFANQFCSFRQNLKLEDKKQANAIALIEKRKPEIIQETIDALNNKINDLEKKIKPTDEATKQDLEKAKAQIEIYEKFLNKKA